MAAQSVFGLNQWPALKASERLRRGACARTSFAMRRSDITLALAPIVVGFVTAYVICRQWRWLDDVDRAAAE